MENKNENKNVNAGENKGRSRKNNKGNWSKSNKKANTNQAKKRPQDIRISSLDAVLALENIVANFTNVDKSIKSAIDILSEKDIDNSTSFSRAMGYLTALIDVLIEFDGVVDLKDIMNRDAYKSYDRYVKDIEKDLEEMEDEYDEGIIYDEF